MDNLWQILSGAPWWVYVLFIYLVSIGIKSTKLRTIPIKRVVLFPLFFVAWSGYELYKNVSLGLPSLILWWVVFLVVGAYFGFKEVHSWRFQKDRHKGLITIPGNYSTLVLVVLIFVLKFFWGYFYATLSSVPHWIYFADTSTSSLVTGFFVGRAIVFFKSYQKR
jgi:hypothetical protein